MMPLGHVQLIDRHFDAGIIPTRLFQTTDVMNLVLSIGVVLTHVVDPDLSAVPAETLAECVRLCFYSTNCASFFYNHDELLCHRSSMLYTVVAGHKLTAKTNVNCYQWRHDKCPSQWTYSKPTGLCLLLFSPSASNTGARQTCVENGGRLVNIQNFKENILIRDIMLENDGGLHIGLKKTSTGWQWHLGEALGAFRFWKNGHPKSGSCVVMSLITRGWYTDSCANKRKYLCEIVLDNPYGDC